MIHRTLLALGTMLLFSGAAFTQTVDTALPEQSAPSSADDSTSAESRWMDDEPGAAAANGHFWVGGDYLLGWFRGARLPALVTTSPAGTPLSSAGILGLQTTSTLFGSSTVNDTIRAGLYVEMGWSSPDGELGVEAGFRLLESQATLFSAASDGSTILAQPYTDATTNLPQSSPIAFPGRSAGSFNIRDASGNFYEVHVDLSENLLDLGRFRFDTLLGYRFYHYDESLHNQATIAAQGAPFVAGTQLLSEDNFGTKNTFHGVDFGFRSQFAQGNLSAEMLANLAVGRLNRDVNIAGNTLVAVPGAAPVFQTGGLYALVSNIGRHTSHDITVLPEFGVTIGWQATRRLRLTAGYTVLWLNEIVRAADQIDQTINPALLPPAMRAPTSGDRPAFRLIRSDASVHSINLGMDFIY